MSPVDLEYKRLFDYVYEHGILRKNRTGTDAISCFSPPQMTFDLCDFPLLTTKHVSLRSIFCELKWFMLGCTDVNWLRQRNVHIWDNDAKRWGSDDLGPIYGKQWRDFNGVDQLYQVVRMIYEEPKSRRIILNSWNASDLDKMALPPCHVMCQFYVRGVCLDCLLYQRSADIGLGVPYNIASYALLTTLLAKVCDLVPGKLYHHTGDAHIYVDHVEPLLFEQFVRKPRPSCHLSLSITASGTVEDRFKTLLNISYNNLKLVDYSPHSSIRLNLS